MTFYTRSQIMYVFTLFQGSAGDDIFTGDMNDYNGLVSWATEKCVPLVRVITFENAEVSADRIGYVAFFFKSL